ncbi:MAG: hypothetical protein M3O70_01755, partial [Actinomycetota bacterium]|nr:hypothetical protein [Actinomycetota bacterium]
MESAIRLLKGLVGFSELLGLEQREGAAAQQLRAADTLTFGGLVKSSHQLVVELHQHLFACHDHMV